MELREKVADLLDHYQMGSVTKNYALDAILALVEEDRRAALVEALRFVRDWMMVTSDERPKAIIDAALASVKEKP